MKQKLECIIKNDTAAYRKISVMLVNIYASQSMNFKDSVKLECENSNYKLYVDVVVNLLEMCLS
ncbi:unnamed protein product [Ilex paraguariensis]|uniref:Uncharacterized protein n=1 Tax=Ilex paraguariensis TaxID=185542 RepID=A0ABC8U0Q0_9AQUA